MKAHTRLTTLMILCFPVLQVFSQSAGINYTYSAQAYGVWTANSGTTVIASNTDDALVAFTPAVAQWNGFYFGSKFFPAGQPIYISSNGFMSFLNPGTSLPTNSLSANPYCIIAPIWDDLKVGSAGNVNWKIVGASPSRRIIVEWNSMFWDKTATTISQSMQVTIYEKTHTTLANVIEIKYYNHGFTGNINIVNGSASIGVNGFCNGDYYSWSTVPGGPGPIKTSETSSHASHPSLSFLYRLTPAAHPNDNCASAQAVTFNPALPLISAEATTLHSTSSGLVGTCWISAITAASDVWFTFTKPAGITNFEVFADNLDCRGVNYRPGIELFTACGSVAIACDYGSAGPAGTNASSYLNLTNQPCTATNYFVRVATDTSYRGNFRFNIRPPGRNCAYPNDLTACGLPYTSSAGLSACGFGNDYDSTNADPHIPTAGEDYVFSYTPPSTSCISFALQNTPVNSNPRLLVCHGCPTSGTCIGLASGAGGSTLTLDHLSLIAGMTYYIIVDQATSGTTSCLTGFGLTVTGSSSSSPVNDLCNAAITLPVVTSTSCTGSVQYHNSCATPTGSGILPLPSCGRFVDGVTSDVWFTFTSSGTSAHQINTDPGTTSPAQDLAMAIYTGSSCTALTLLGCDDHSGGASMPSLTVFPPSSGTVYYVRIWSNNPTAPGNFRICVVNSCAPQNDVCGGAVTLSNGITVTGDNGCSSGTNEPFASIGASCWTNSGGAFNLNTVWYQFTATNDTMVVRTHLLTLYDSQIALYSSSGGCNGVFTQLFCNNDAIPSCGTVQNRSSEIKATGLTTGQTYYVRLDGTGSNTGSFEITVVDNGSNSPPANPATPSGNAIVCRNTSESYSVPAVSGATSYTWVAPSGSTVSAGQGTNSVTLSFGSSALSGNLCVYASNGCGNSASICKPISVVTSAPTTPSSITGTTLPCANSTGVPYSCPIVTTASSYNWTVPSTATIVSGQGTNSITVNFASNFSSGSIKVQSVNCYGSSSFRSLTVRGKPSTPGIITGPATGVCAGTNGVAYSIPAVTGASTYTWTSPINATIAIGQGTNSVTVNFSASFISGTLSVTAGNTCGNSAARTLTIYSVPTTPGTITGSSIGVCAGTNGVAYSIAPASGATSYTWTAPPNASIATVQGTTAVTVNYSASFTTGTLSVKAVNSCGLSGNRTLSIKSVPTTPGTMTGLATVCANQAGVAYSIVAVAGATTYNWVVPTGATVATGQGTTSVTVNFGASGGSVKVQAGNICGYSSFRTKSVSITCRETNAIFSPAEYEFLVYPNPAVQKATLVFSDDVNEPAKITLTDVAGRVLGLYNLQTEAGKNSIELDLSDISSGTYVISLSTVRFARYKILIVE